MFKSVGLQIVARIQILGENLRVFSKSNGGYGKISGICSPLSMHAIYQYNEWDKRINSFPCTTQNIFQRKMHINLKQLNPFLAIKIYMTIRLSYISTI